MKYKNTITLSLILISLVLIVFYFQSKSPKTDKQPTKQPIEEQKISYSRITFFNASEHRASMAIPDYWEGKYRIREEGDTVVFLDISNPSDPKELFWISYRDAKNWNQQQNPDWLKVGQVDKTIFVYKLSTAQAGSSSEFLKMQKEVAGIFSSFVAK